MEEINEKLHMELLDFDVEKRKQWMQERKPFSVLFELTPKCNMNCIHCYLQNNHFKEHLTYDEIIKIIDVLFEKGILFLTLTGGEIFTRKDFKDIYLYAKRKGFLVELFTNGYLISDEIINVFKEYPPLLVDISLYGASEDTYYKITGVKGAFSRVITNVQKLKEANIRVSLKSPILRETLDELSDMKKIGEKMGIPFVYTFEICPTIDKNNEPKNHQVPLAEVLKYEFENYYEQIRNEERKPGVDIQAINELINNPFVYRCNVAVNSFIIDYQGKICPCMKLRHKGEKLSEDNFDELWLKFGEYSKVLASDEYACKGCTAAYYCDVCPAEMDLLYGNMEYRHFSMCKIAKIRKDFYEQKITFEEAIEQASFNE